MQPNARQVPSSPHWSMLVQSPRMRSPNATTDATRVTVPSSQSPVDGRRRAAAPAEPAALAIAKPTLVSTTLSSA